MGKPNPFSSTDAALGASANLALVLDRGQAPAIATAPGEALKLGTPAQGISEIDRRNLTSRVYAELRDAMMAGRFHPGQRIKIRDAALALRVSWTPVREAIMQLVREGGLEARAGQAFTVVRLTAARYLELREIRLRLESLATERAVEHLDDAAIDNLARIHDELVKAEKSGDYATAVRANYQFHHGIYSASRMTDLVSILEGLWLRTGPIINLQYPHAPPTYPGRHQHLNVLEALRMRAPRLAGEAIQSDILEGGRKLVTLLQQIDAGTARITHRDGRGFTVEGFVDSDAA